MTRLLVVTADDFGLTDGVNRAVVRSHREGIVTSTSLLAVGRAYQSAVELARRTPTLTVGVHLAAVGEDPPLLAASDVPSLVDGSGHFPLSYRTVLRRAFLGRLDVEDVRREFRAQIERVMGDGLAVSHLDTHQHLHLWPAIAQVVTELARDYGIPAVRLPRSHRHGAARAGRRRPCLRPGPAAGRRRPAAHRRLRGAGRGWGDGPRTADRPERAGPTRRGHLRAQRPPGLGPATPTWPASRGATGGTVSWPALTDPALAALVTDTGFRRS